MMRVIINGACGRMGTQLQAVIAKHEDISISALVDASGNNGAFTNIDDVSAEADVIIDFSNHTSAPAICEYATKHNIPLVIATTGHTEEEYAVMKKAAESIPVFASANMSLGIALLADITKKAVSFFPDADIEIIEIHHNQKVDAPSGTAILLADAITEVRPESNCIYGRHGYSKRTKNEIGIHSLRSGNIMGEHEVIINSGTQTISLKHQAHDRAVFADGAISAAYFITGKPAGYYSMKDILAEG